MQLRTASAFMCLVVALGLLLGCGSGHSATASTPGATTPSSQPDNTTATVTPTVTGFTMSSSSVSIAAGQTAQLSATATYSDSSTQPLTSATWTTSNSSVATVSSSGLVTAVGVCTATITVSYGSFSQTVSITVIPGALGTDQPYPGQRLHCHQPDNTIHRQWNLQRRQYAGDNKAGELEFVGC